MRREPDDLRDERGMGGIEGLAFGVLIFVFGTLVVTNAWGVIDAKWATTSAAREATRAFVEAATRDEAQSAAARAANDAMVGQNHPMTAVSAATADGFQRCGVVVVLVTTKVPRIALPLLERSGGNYTVTGRHSEIIDPYRSGIAGSAACRG